MRAARAAARLAGASVLAACSVAGVAAAPAQASPPASGWWTVAPAAASPAPAGGIWVANGAAGPVAVSALRGTVSEGASPTVVLTLAPGATTPVVAIDACPSRDAWAPAQGGAMADAPAADCDSGRVTGVVDAAAGTVSWPLPASFVRTGVVDVVLLPAAGAAPFSAPFAAPDDSSFATPGGAPAGDSGGGSGSDTAPAAEPSPSSEPFSPPSAGGSGGTGLFPPAGNLGLGAPAAGDPPAVAAPSTPAAQAPTSGGSRRLTRPVARAVPTDARSSRVLAVVLLGLMAFAAYRLAETEARPPRLLGALHGGAAARADAAVASARSGRARGVGRFARTRTGPPPAI